MTVHRANAKGDALPVSFQGFVKRRWLAASVVTALATLCVAAPAGSEAVPPTPPKTTPQSQTIEFRPHRAVYEVTLSRVSAGSSIARLAGRMVYELGGNVCDGYTQQLRFVTRTANQIGDAQTNDLRTKSWESPNGDTLRFDIQNFHDEDLSDASKGVAKRDAHVGVVTVNLKKPTPKQSKVSDKPLFPMAHARAVIKAARAGKPIFSTAFYDGSETGDKVYQTTAAIGKPVAAVELSGSEKNASPLDRANTSPSWPIAMSYYDVAQQSEDGRPSFEMSYRFHVNGVTSKFKIDHGDFAFKGTMSQLLFTAPSGCQKSKTKKR